ncbi:hypothetical protein ASPNIDRAFT_42318 [Aspergillus niger ATCC 1015]|uniref:Aminoglycoside phosphotransferase domain-containing protein n=2 Tax=Aspergillus niger TaxID=5061 RepID=G3XVS0_ASPNA|nr:hypothetical protein ASPNIDRAFT_42318 [Aspergillus niger ATCC 1015]KAI2829164.1 hypothetical protein CBS133816_4701 [Aspergillus niger]KAI2983481.1 hypothetical protein CBS147345_11164 [Aspergillus niger]TPR06134.1 hypothetical protein CAN33_0019895 [Aspergillus niger]SPB46041.1 unnamed protein product [Aspergillus niger]
MVGQTFVRDTPSKKLSGAAAEAAAKVNKLLLHDFTVKVNNNPSTNLTELLQFKLKTYPPLRQNSVDSAVESTSTKSTDTTTGTAPDVREEFLIPSDVVIIRPLSMAVTQAVQSVSSCDSDSSEISSAIRGLNDLILRSDILWHWGSTAVLGLTPNLALKLGNYIDVNYLAMVEEIKHQTLRIPIPEIHGVLQQSGTRWKFIFMSRVPGVPLDSIWKTLNPHQKASVQDQLNVMFTDLRSLPFSPSDEPGAVYGGGTPRRCKDTRREIRVADAPISNEREFNCFLSFNPRRTGTGHHAMLRAYMATDHRLVMTHADLHPRNIMVTLTPCSPGTNEVDGLCLQASTALAGTDDLPSGQVTITGIIDWEMCGWYPEYWEYLKALNTPFGGGEFDDWWKYLPPIIGTWPREHAVDLMLDGWCR